MMDAHAQAQATTQAGHVRQALAVEGGHLFIGHLAWQAPDGSVVNLLDEDDIAHARLIAAAPRLRAALAALAAWSARTGHGGARPWQDARALLDALRNPHAED